MRNIRRGFVIVLLIGVGILAIVVVPKKIHPPVTAPTPLPTSLPVSVAATPTTRAELTVAPGGSPQRLADTAVTADFHPQVASVIAAQQTGAYPERLTLVIDPKPFDAAAFAQQPQAYLSVVEPGRVYDTAAAGPEAVPLIAMVDHTILIPALGSTPLSVRGKPQAPVSFTVLGGGVFDNHLAAITVLADEAGVARVRYTATPGTTGEAQILAGSPLTVGTLMLSVHVQGTVRDDAPAPVPMVAR
jgi:hypothetical protein